MDVSAPKPVSGVRSHREEFGQAAFGADPSVLAMIRDPRLNLAVWEGAINLADHHAYLSGLDFADLAPHKAWSSGYRREILSQEWHTNELCDATRPLALNGVLAQAGFPDDHGARMDMARALFDLAGHFAAACKPNGGRIGMSLMEFQPSDQNFWHIDLGHYAGLLTLHGTAGTWWRPDHTLRENGRDIRATPVRADDTLAQSVAPGDLAILKCRDTDQGLVHASPPVPGHRLVMVMWPY